MHFEYLFTFCAILRNILRYKKSRNLSYQHCYLKKRKRLRVSFDPFDTNSSKNPKQRLFKSNSPARVINIRLKTRERRMNNRNQ